MKMINLSEQDKRTAFALKVAKHFEENPEHRTYTVDGKIEPYELFAVKWGVCDDCVLVFRLSYDEPEIYQNIIKLDKQ